VLVLNIVLFGLLVFCLAFSIYWGLLNRQKYRAYIKMANELDRVMGDAVALVQDNQMLNDSFKKNHAPAIATVEDLYKPPEGYNGDVDLESSEMLSTILTVIIHKYGAAKLSLEDFYRVPENEYISVYVDSKSKKLILSADHNLTDKDPLNMISFTNSDDSTFH